MTINELLVTGQYNVSEMSQNLKGGLKYLQVNYNVETMSLSADLITDGQAKFYGWDTISFNICSPMSPSEIVERLQYVVK